MTNQNRAGQAHKYAAVLALLAALALPGTAAAQDVPNPKEPVVSRVEPPNWWVGLTPEVMLLVSGRHLEATHVGCNLPSLTVERTQAAGGGSYLFVWLKIGAETRSGTAVCRVETSAGRASFELPLAARAPVTGKFQGLAANDVLYFVQSELSSGGGGLRAIGARLSEWKDLGVTTLRLAPVMKGETVPGRNAFGATDLYAVDPRLGTLNDYQELVAEAHRQRMKIFLDVVPNHVGPSHPWVKNPPMPDWFHGTFDHHLNASTPGDGSFYGKPATGQAASDPFEAIVDPHATSSMTRSLTDSWLFGTLPDLNTENPAVFQYLEQNSIWWAESSGLDGFCAGAVPYVPRVFWALWHAGLRAIYPRLATIGAVADPAPNITSYFAGGRKQWDGVDSGFTTLLDYPLSYALRDVLLDGAPAGRIADVLRQDALYPRPNLLVSFFSGRDDARFGSTEEASLQKQKLAIGLVLTLRGIPGLYLGGETGVSGDSRNEAAPQGRMPRQQEALAYVRDLLKLRREHPALQDGTLSHLYSDKDSYIFLRQSEDERLVVIFNNSAQARTLDVELHDTPAQDANSAVWLSGDADAQITPGKLQVSAPAQSLSIFSLN